MEKKLKELSMCFELKAPKHIIVEIIQEILCFPHAIEYLKEKWKNLNDAIYSSSSDVNELSINDIVWNLHVIETDCKGL